MPTVEVATYLQRGKMKNLEISVLNDYYGGLLNAHQSEIMRLYYDCDMSLAEIADETGITRQGVREVLVRSTKRLEEYEQKLGLINKIKGVAEKLQAIIGSTDEGQHKEELKKLLKSIKEI
jgi:predicted DNA-binding protein YlxM (UPF0122 family)